MVDGQSYHLLADSEHSNDNITFIKNKTKIISIICGREFPNTGSIHWYDLSIMNRLEFIEITDINFPSDLQSIDVEVYMQIIGNLTLPT
ncbi:hypothetical protein [Metabacillus fastidiosus]|uniref:hypothetical protein n=1 Tax=Metabacillus fastidiosus TaxID=1458 RepID=UPI003D2D32F2